MSIIYEIIWLRDRESGTRN